MYILEKTKITASMFEGRGFIAHAKDNIQRRGMLGALANGNDIYLSRDAVEGILQWISLWEDALRQPKSEFPDNRLYIGKLEFILYDEMNYGYNAMELLSKEDAWKILGTVRKNFTIGFERRPWSDVSRFPAYCETGSYNHPGRMVVIAKDPTRIEYNLRLGGASSNEQVYATADFTTVRIAEALLSVADTNTYPANGYKLDLKLGFGNLELAELSRNQIRDIAERLIP